MIYTLPKTDNTDCARPFFEYVSRLFSHTPPMKKLILLLAALMLVAPAEAATQKKDPKKEAREKERALREKDREAIKDFLEPKDKNKDGTLTRAEYLSDEDDKAAAGKDYDEADKNKDRSLSKTEISEMLGLGKELEALKNAEKAKKKK